MHEKTRAYFVGNMYLSSIQQGIQAGHVINELHVNYEKTNALLNQWAEIDKVMILLNGGYQSAIEQFRVDLENDFVDLDIPYAEFYEEDEALNGALTSFGFVLPESIFDAELVEVTQPIHDTIDMGIDRGTSTALRVKDFTGDRIQEEAIKRIHLKLKTLRLAS